MILHRMQNVDLLDRVLTSAELIAATSSPEVIAGQLVDAVAGLPGVSFVAFVERAAPRQVAPDGVDARGRHAAAPEGLRASVPVRSALAEGDLLVVARTEEDLPAIAQAARYLARLTEQRLEAIGARTETSRRIANVVHELRAPLGPILLAAQQLRRRGIGEVEAGTIARQAHRLALLVDDLLEEGKGSRPLVLETVEAARLVEQALEISRPAVERFGHRIETQAGAGLLCHVDAERLVQVLTNLLVNAARYTPPPGSIQIAVAESDGRVIFEVRDDGAGIPASQLERIFQPFVQLPGAAGGAGLGLPLARSLLELHGGWISARSEGPGRGSCFTISLPQADRFLAAPKLLIVGESLRGLVPQLATRGVVGLAVRTAVKAGGVLQSVAVSGMVIERGVRAHLATPPELRTLVLDPPGNPDEVEAALLEPRH